jgi:hypothetical protein
MVTHSVPAGQADSCADFHLWQIPHFSPGDLCVLSVSAVQLVFLRGSKGLAGRGDEVEESESIGNIRRNAESLADSADPGR